MTSRDTYDVESYEEEVRQLYQDHLDRSAEEFVMMEQYAEERSINVQPRLLASLMIESEPTLFSGVTTRSVYSVPEWISSALAMMHEWTRWHAQLQIAYERSVFVEGEEK